MPTVIAVHKEKSGDGTHQHIAKVKTSADMTYTRAQVVASLDKNESWKTSGTDGSTAVIKKGSCSTCLLTPYITTAPDHTTKNNLDNLPTF